MCQRFPPFRPGYVRKLLFMLHLLTKRLSLQEWWEEFSSLGSPLCADLFQYLFHPPVTVVAHERSCVTVVAHKRWGSFCQKCRWPVTTKHTCTLHMWLWTKWHCKLLHGCMVYTELVLRRQQFHMAPAMQQPSSTVSMPLQWNFFLNTL